MFNNMTDNIRSKLISLLKIERRWLWVIFYLLIVVWMVYLLNQAQHWDNFQDYLFPYISIGLILVLIGLHLLLVWDLDAINRLFAPLMKDSGGMMASFQPEIEDGKQITTVENDELPIVEMRKRLVVLSLWVIVLPPILFYVGFTFGFPLYVMLFGYYATRSIGKASLVTVVFLLVVFVLFIIILDIPFWDGVLGLPDLYDFI